MQIIVSYHERDTYDVPDERWCEAMALCEGCEDDAFDFLMVAGRDFFCETDVTDRYIDAVRET
jgi:hypothetical protein